MSNGDLVRTASREGFEVIVTVDTNMPHQTLISKLSIAVVVVEVPNNRLETLIGVRGAILATLEDVAAGHYHIVSARQ